jgi:hypothetical protein
MTPETFEGFNEFMAIVTVFVILLAVVFFAWAATKDRKHPGESRNHTGHRRKKGYLDGETGWIVVGDRLIHPSKAAKMNVEIVGFYEPPKPPAGPRKRSLKYYEQ